MRFSVRDAAGSAPWSHIPGAKHVRIEFTYQWQDCTVTGVDIADA